MDLDNLKKSLMAVGFLSIGSGIAAIYGFISIILVNIFAKLVYDGKIDVTSTANTTIQTTAGTVTTAVVAILGLITLISGLASLVIVVLALLGKVNFTSMTGGGNKAF